MKVVKGKKGNVTIYLVFMFVAILIVIIASVIAPLGVLINTEFYAAGEDIYMRANESISNINNATVRDNIRGIINGGFDNIENNIEINNAVFQYSWVIVLALGGLIAFLFTRALVEQQTGGLI